ncbi:MAG: hypothetical protein M3410_04850 [Acidobacteriota bacterium]|nr:hypothetical protein [Acidobacteriota bacterium]
MNRKGQEFASTEESELEEQFVETYLAKVGDTIRVSDIARYGLKPLELRVRSAESLFASEPAATDIKPKKH